MTRTGVARTIGIMGLFAAMTVAPHVLAQREGRQADTPRSVSAPTGERGAAPQGDEQRLNGTFRLDEPPDRATAMIEADIERAVNEMPFLTRSFGRNRLRATNPAARRIVVEIEGDRLAVAFDDEARYEGRDGQWINVMARGEQSRLLMQRRPGRVYMTFRSENGQKRMVLTASEDGSYMWLDVEVTSDRLPTPLTYRLPYRRAA